MAYDVYLEILHRVDLLVDASLGRSDPDWRLKNSCPACNYELDNESPLRYAKLFCIDGNNSLKLIDASMRRGNLRKDTRTNRTDYWLSTEYVDIYKDEVHSANHGKGQAVPTDDDDDEDWLDLDEEPGHSGQFKKTSQDIDNPVPDAALTPCVKRWKNAGPEARKKMFAMFHIAGIFVALCRHGFVLLVCDMIRSGEL